MNGDANRFEQCCVEHRDRLKRMVRLRLDPRLHGRIDASDVLQEALLEASSRLDEYRQNPASRCSSGCGS